MLDRGRGRVPTAAFLLVMAIAWLATPARAEDEIIVGATIPLTGPLAASGLQYFDGLQLAQDDINAAGGINGRRLHIVFEDTQASNSVAVNAFIKLAQQQEPVFIFLSSYTIQNLAVEQAVAKARIPVAYGGGAAALADRHNKWMFRIRPPDALAAEAIGTSLASLMHAQNVGILHVQDDYGTATANAAIAAMAKAGVTVAGSESYGARDNDISPQLLSLKAKGAQALVLFSYIRDGALILTQRRTLGLDIPVMGNSSFVFSSLLDLVTPADVDGLYSETDAVLGDGVGPSSADYVKRFTARFGMKPDAFGSAYYDAAMILADALRKVGPDRDKVRDYFAGLKDYHGVTRVFTTDDRGDMAHSVALVHFKPGTTDFTLAGTYPAP